MQLPEGAFVPDIEEGVPLPANAMEAFPPLTPDEELQMRARTIKLLGDITKINPIVTERNRVEAEQLARQMIVNPETRPEFAKYPNETLEYLAGLVAQMNSTIVTELAELKTYTINHLIHTVEHPDSQKNKLIALKLLGEISGVDAFMKRSEVTVQVKPLAQVEKELKTIIESLDHTVVSQSSSPVSSSHSLVPHEAEYQDTPS